MEDINELKNTLNSVKTTVKYLEKRIDIFKTEKEEEEKRNGKQWKPKINEDYWTIKLCKVAQSKWLDDDMDNFRYLLGHCFKTKEEADFELERLKVIAEMKEFTYEFSNDEWESRKYKYFLYFNRNNNKIDCSYNIGLQRNDLYFKSCEDIQTCIDTVGVDRIKKYYFRLDL